MKHEFKLEEELCIISKYTLDTLFKKCPDAVTLYLFYYYTAKWQNTNQPKATPSYCKKGLGWGDIRFAKADKVLRELDLVEKIADRDEKGKIIGWYVKLNYIWSKEKIKTLKPEPLETRAVENPPSGKKSTNALSVNSLNALSVNINTTDESNSSGQKEKKSFRETKYPVEWYDQVLKEYCELKNIAPKGDEWNLLKREVKLMFQNGRTPEEIIKAMRRMAYIAEKHKLSWKLGTIRVRMPELLAGR